MLRLPLLSHLKKALSNPWVNRCASLKSPKHPCLTHPTPTHPWPLKRCLSAQMQQLQLSLLMRLCLRNQPPLLKPQRQTPSPKLSPRSLNSSQELSLSLHLWLHRQRQFRHRLLQCLYNSRHSSSLWCSRAMLLLLSLRMFRDSSLTSKILIKRLPLTSSTSRLLNIRWCSNNPTNISRCPITTTNSSRCHTDSTIITTMAIRVATKTSSTRTTITLVDPATTTTTMLLAISHSMVVQINTRCLTTDNSSSSISRTILVDSKTKIWTWIASNNNLLCPCLCPRATTHSNKHHKRLTCQLDTIHLPVWQSKRLLSLKRSSEAKSWSECTKSERK